MDYFEEKNSATNHAHHTQLLGLAPKPVELMAI